MKRGTERVVLVAGIGTSPAVLTETVWALAHQDEPVVPNEVVVITTSSGKDALRAAVMSGAPSANVRRNVHPRDSRRSRQRGG